MSCDRGLCTAYLTAMQVLAKPWNGMILGVLRDGPLRFCELSARVPSIGDRILAARLKELEARGILLRSVAPGPPVRVTYELTDAGRGFEHAAEAITTWGQTLERAQPRRTAAPLRAGRRR